MAGAIMNKVWDFLGVETGATEEELENENMYTYNYDKEVDTEEEQEEKSQKVVEKFGKVVEINAFRGNYKTNYK